MTKITMRLQKTFKKKNYNYKEKKLQLRENHLTMTVFVVPFMKKS